LCLDGLSRNRFWGNTTTHRNKSLKVQQVTRLTDTIFALATPPGKSAVQIIRISGAGAARALKAMIGHVPPPRHAHFAALSDANGDVLDQALVLYFQAPASATGEDTVELHLHGSPVLGRMVMERLETLPRFRLADPGEFSRRAFLNGKINLDQAEGIADIIDANTITQHQQAIRQLDGVLSRKTDDWRQMIISIGRTDRFC
jgi:tRNA modification GTPase